ncbi:MAG: hypothetical protein E6H39_00090 [Betaproteobacteria bacterium]|nr:MAG: hypothetical protein E6H39_00090 [Betaproteobacteria bacterium]
MGAVTARREGWPGSGAGRPRPAPDALPHRRASGARRHGARGARARRSRADGARRRDARRQLPRRVDQG